MPDHINREEGRRLFGLDPEGYDAGRPDYPLWIFEHLKTWGALGNETSTLEIGPGSGLATRRLLEYGANPLLLVEPDERFADTLNKSVHGMDADCQVLHESFENVEIADHAFDLVACATAFHWIEAVPGLKKIKRLLRHDGSVALFWNVLQDLDKADPFHEATSDLLASLATNPSGVPNTLPYALDQTARRADATKAGFAEVMYRESRWTHVISTEQVGKLYGGFSPIQHLDPNERESLLFRLMDIADSQFNGKVERNVTSCLYLISG